MKPFQILRQPQTLISMILNIYLIVLCTLLPLYMPEGYLALGEHKFMLYRTITLAAMIPCVLLMLFDHAKADTRESAMFDAVLFVSAIARLMCFLLSENRALSLFGLGGWRDGFFFEIALLLTAYFFAHYFKPFRCLRIPVLAGPAVVYLITAAQCLLIPDPHRYFFATIGNANWYAGFLSVFLPAGVAFLTGGQSITRVKRFLYSSYLLLALLACVLQKSVSICLSFAVTAVLAGCVKMTLSSKKERALRGFRLFQTTVYLIVPVCLLILLLQLLYPFPASFGNNRGIIWRSAADIIKSFHPGQWLFGIGHDLFAQAVERRPDLNAALIAVFRDARVTNAHAELLQMLVTQGLTGVCTFLAMIFMTLRNALNRINGPNREGALCCIMVTASYLANQTVSFRQVLSSPFLYILAGVCFSPDLHDAGSVVEQMSAD